MTEEISTIEAHRQMTHRRARRLEITKGMSRKEIIDRVNKSVDKRNQKKANPILKLSNLADLKENDLERLTALMLGRQGYDVERNVWIRGKSDERYDIDIYAEKQKWLGIVRGYSLIAEIKNSEIGIDSIISYKLIFEDISSRLKMNQCMMVTNKSFTSEARKYAEDFEINILDREELTKKLEENGLIWLTKEEEK